MFGIELATLSFWAVTAETGVLFYQLSHYLAKRRDKTRVRFLLLILVFLFYNIVNGLLPDQASVTSLSPLAFVWSVSSFLLFVYYFYYLYKELNVTRRQTMKTSLFLLIITGTFFSCFLLLYLVTNDLLFSIRISTLTPIFPALYFSIRLASYILRSNVATIEQKSPYRLIFRTTFFGCFIIASVPFSFMLGSFRMFDSILVNATFFMSFFAYMRYQLFQSRVEEELLGRMEGLYGHSMAENLNFSISFLNSSLTPRERDLALLILEGLSYMEIAKVSHITRKTVSKHASNIFKKMRCKDREEFISRFAKVDK